MNDFIEFCGDAFLSAGTALSLDPSLLKSVDDISYEQANAWIKDELSTINKECKEELQYRIDRSLELVNDIHMSSCWPIATNAHLHLICVLSQLNGDQTTSNSGANDMSLVDASQWAEDEVEYRLNFDIFEIADHIAKLADKLRDQQLCEQFPNSAFAYRKLIANLSVVLHEQRGLLH